MAAIGLTQMLGNSVFNLFDSAWESILTPIQAWLDQHAFLSWLFTHPFWLLIAIVLGIFLLSGLLGAIARLTERIWLALLRAPIQLLHWLFRQLAHFIKSFFKPSPTPTAIEPPPPDRLTQLLDRLEALKQEQDEVMQEVRQLLVANLAAKK